MRIQNSKAAALATLLTARAAGRVSTRLAGRVTDTLWFTPWRVGSASTHEKADAWERGTTRLELPDGLVAHATGTGPTVMLVHGWGDRGATLRLLADELARCGYRAVALDLPAHGTSAGTQTNLFHASAAVRTAAAALGPISAIVTHSIGGPVALLAIEDGLQVDAAALIAPMITLESAIEVFQRDLALPDRAVEGLRGRILERFGRHVWEDTEANRLGPVLGIPGLVVADHDDPKVPFELIAGFADSWPESRLLATEGLGHNRILRDDTVLDAVTEFVATHVPVTERTLVSV